MDHENAKKPGHISSKNSKDDSNTHARKRDTSEKVKSQRGISRLFSNRKRSPTDDKGLPRKQDVKQDKEASLPDILRIPGSSNPQDNAEKLPSSTLKTQNSGPGNESTSMPSAKRTFSNVPNWLSQHLPSRQKTKKEKPALNGSKLETAVKEVDSSSGSTNAHWNWWYNPAITTDGKIDPSKKTQHSVPERSKITASSVEKKQQVVTDKPDPKQDKTTMKPSGGTNDKAESTINKWYSFRYHHPKPFPKTTGSDVPVEKKLETNPTSKDSPEGQLKDKSSSKWHSFRYHNPKPFPKTTGSDVPVEKQLETKPKSKDSPEGQLKDKPSSKWQFFKHRKPSNSASNNKGQLVTENPEQSKTNVDVTPGSEPDQTKSTVPKNRQQSKWQLLKKRLSKSDPNVNKSTVPGSEKKPGDSKKATKSEDSMSLK